jgi:hypothetical protein
MGPNAGAMLATLRRDATAALEFIRAACRSAMASGPTSPSAVVAEEDCEFLIQLAETLSMRMENFGESDSRFLAAYPDLVQLSFHLHDEIEHYRQQADARVLAAAIGFLHRHTERLRCDFGPSNPRGIGLTDRLLLRLLAGYTASAWRRLVAAHPFLARSGRPFVDKLFRDYRLTGFPDHMLATASRISESRDFDRHICILRGGLPYALLFDLLSGGSAGLRHVACGRPGGSRYSPDVVVSPVDFSVGDVRAARILLIDNNILTGATLRAVAAHLAVGRPASVCVLVDYIVDPNTGGRRIEGGPPVPPGLRVIVAAAETSKKPGQTVLKRRLAHDLARRVLGLKRF